MSRFSRRHRLGRRDGFSTWSRSPSSCVLQIQRSGGTLLAHLFDNHPSCLTFPGELYLNPSSDQTWPEVALEKLETYKAFAYLLSAHAHFFLRYIKDGFSNYERIRPGEERHPFLFSVTIQYEAYLKTLAGSTHPRPRQVFDAYLGSVFTAWLDHQQKFKAKKYFVAHTKRWNWRPQGSQVLRGIPGRLSALGGARSPRCSSEANPSSALGHELITG